MATASDAELVLRHRAGDPQAFAELVRRYTPILYNLAWRYTGDPAEAENLTQETFFRAWQALPQVKLDQPLKPYLLRIIINLSHDWADKHKQAVLGPLPDEDTLPLAQDDDELERLTDDELVERVRDALEQLSPAYRVVLTLRYTEDLSYQEMALALDLPLNTVRTHLRRAKARLQDLLERE